MGDLTSASERGHLRVLRVAHHGVVGAWRERERKLIELGVDLTMVSARRWNEGGREVALDPGPDRFLVGVDTLGRHPNGFLYNPVPLWRLLGRDWDLIDLHEEPCALATAEMLALMRLRSNRAPVVLYSAQNIAKRYPVPIRWFEGAALRRAAGAYVCNAEAGHILRAKGLRTPATLLGLGVDLSVFSVGEHQAPRKPLVVGYSGRLEKYKGVDVLIKAVAEATDTVLLVAGDGPEAEALRALVTALGIAGRVTFLGHLGSDLPAFYRGLDVLVVPSLPTKGWLEQFGRVVIEAMASGVPVIASQSGALPDVVGSAGLLVEPGSPEAISLALSSVADPLVWRSLRAAGLQHCLQYSWLAIATEQLAFYNDVLGASERTDPEVIIVAYGAPTTLPLAVAPLVGRSITIVDNSSLPETRRIAHECGAHYIDAGGNLGFGAAVNVALASLDERGRGRNDVLLLNPDAAISGEGLEALRAQLHERPGVACIGPRQVRPGSEKPDRVEWPFPTPWGAWSIALGLGRFQRRLGFVIGSILLLNRAALDDVGLFDEQFFLYAEETDWQRRAVSRGWAVAYEPRVTGTHVGAGTSTDEGVRSELFHTSQLTYMKKHFGALGAAAFRGAMVVGALIRIAAGRGHVRQNALWRLRFYINPKFRKTSARSQHE